MKIEVPKLIQSAGRYALRHPRYLLDVARHATGLRAAVPVDALRWLLGELLGGVRAVKRLDVTARPPGLRIEASLRVMGAPLEAALTLEVLSVRLSGEALRVEVRARDVSLEAPGEDPSPIKALLASGALDLGKPANLVSFMPRRPAFLVGAEGDTFVLDFLKLPALAGNTGLRAALGRITPVLTLQGIRTEGDLILLALRASPAGIKEAVLGTP